MKKIHFSNLAASACLVASICLTPASAQQPSQPEAAILNAAKAQKQPLLDTLKEFVSIETGSRDIEGINRATELLASKMTALGAQVEYIEPQEATTYRMFDTTDKIGRMVRATFKGTGTQRILLIAHIDTVYLKGMLEKQPFRIDGNLAYCLGISDD